MIQWKDVAYFYVGCDCMYTGMVNKKKLTGRWLSSLQEKGINVKPILRRLSSMKEEEAIKLIVILFSDDSIDKVDPDEIQIHLAQNDGGLMMDADMSLVIDVTCRCFEGQIAIRECGSIMLFNEDGELQRLANIPQAFAYLLSEGFDLFRLIDSSQAIEKK